MEDTNTIFNSIGDEATLKKIKDRTLKRERALALAKEVLDRVKTNGASSAAAVKELTAAIEALEKVPNGKITDFANKQDNEEETGNEDDLDSEEKEENDIEWELEGQEAANEDNEPILRGMAGDETGSKDSTKKEESEGGSEEENEEEEEAEEDSDDLASEDDLINSIDDLTDDNNDIENDDSEEDSEEENEEDSEEAEESEEEPEEENEEDSEEEFEEESEEEEKSEDREKSENTDDENETESENDKIKTDDDDEIKTWDDNKNKQQTEEEVGKTKINLDNDLIKAGILKILRNLNSGTTESFSCNSALISINEAVEKTLATMSDAEFNQLINRVLDAVESVFPKQVEIMSDKEQQLLAQEIKDELNDETIINEISKEDENALRKEHQVIKAREKELNKYGRPAGGFPGFQEFIDSLYRAIKIQVSSTEQENDSWRAINKRHVDDGVIVPGKKVQEFPDKLVPIIDFYFDVSGSWGQTEIQKGKEAVAVLKDLEAKGQLKINIFYFGDQVSTSSYGNGFGTSAWGEIVRNVILTKATNVVIMTDDDMQGQGNHNRKYTVPGFVWYLWKNGLNASRLPKELNGRSGTSQFKFSVN